jgi:hypothetical protein
MGQSNVLVHPGAQIHVSVRGSCVSLEKYAVSLLKHGVSVVKHASGVFKHAVTNAAFPFRSVRRRRAVLDGEVASR